MNAYLYFCLQVRRFVDVRSRVAAESSRSVQYHDTVVALFVRRAFQFHASRAKRTRRIRSRGKRVSGSCLIDWSSIVLVRNEWLNRVSRLRLYFACHFCLSRLFRNQPSVAAPSEARFEPSHPLNDPAANSDLAQRAAVQRTPNIRVKVEPYMTTIHCTMFIKRSKIFGSSPCHEDYREYFYIWRIVMNFDMH